MYSSLDEPIYTAVHKPLEPNHLSPKHANYYDVEEERRTIKTSSLKFQRLRSGNITNSYKYQQQAHLWRKKKIMPCPVSLSLALSPALVRDGRHQAVKKQFEKLSATFQITKVHSNGYSLKANTALHIAICC